MKRRKRRPECVAPRVTEAPASVLYGTLRRPTERNTVRMSDFGDAVENICIIRANPTQWV